MEITYSIIIPHKNTPQLLERCLASIPKRDDIQIIVIDDNSSPDVVDFKDFPGMNLSKVEIILTKEGRGAGYARNCGLTRAVGKWVLFADADDFFNPCFSMAIDEFNRDTYDIIFFDSNTVDSETMEVLPNRSQRKTDMDQIEWLRFKNTVPWSKMISRHLIEEYYICFDETIAANDVLFSVSIGFYARNVVFSPYTIYCATVRKNSLWYGMAYNSLLARTDVSCRYNRFLRQKLLPEYLREYSYAYVKRAKAFGLKAYLRALWIYLCEEYPIYIWHDLSELVKVKLKMK